MSRGQVTIFVILGIVILIAVGILVVFRNDLLVSESERESKIGVSEQFKPVRDYYETCLREVALEGLNVVGSQGGYLEVPDDIRAEDINGFNSYMDVFGNRAVKVPYWYYKQGNNVDVIKVPGLDGIKKNVEDYIAGNIGRCFDGRILLNEYRIKGYGNIKPEVEIKDETVFVRVKTPIDVEFKGVTETIDELYISLDVPLGKLYNTAKGLFEKENKEMFIEERTIDYMALYDEIPLSGANLDCDTKVWSKQQV